MLRSFFLSFLLASFVLGQQSSQQCPVKLPQDKPETQSNRSTTPRIVGGSPIASGLLPYLVAIQRIEGRSDKWSTKCTGTLISQRWALSAAHCDISKTDRVLLLADNTADGVTMKPEGEAVAVEIATVHRHPDYIESDADGSQFDIVAMELKSDAPKDAKFMKVCINKNIPEEKSFVRVAGFGLQFEDESPSLGRPLLQVDVPVTSFSTCESVYGLGAGLRIDPTRHVCAGYSKGGCDSWYVLSQNASGTHVSAYHPALG